MTLIMTMGACTKDFEEININPNAPSAVPLEYLLAQSTLQIAGEGGDPGYRSWRTNIIYCAMMMQQMSSTEVTFYRGTVYTFQGDLSAAWFERAYPNSVKNLVNLINLSKKDPKMVNVNSIARILKVIEMATLTDLYGDVPYSEAGLGALNGIFSPKYDEQKAIYADMLKELDEAGTALNASANYYKSADMVYGNGTSNSTAQSIDKWKRAANSLMLRLAMRMQKADAAAAKSWAKKATDKGLMMSNEDSFSLKYADSGAGANANPNSWNMNGVGRGIVTADNIQWGKTYIDALIKRKDPRLSVVSTLKTGDRSPDKQIGLPIGTDAIMLSALPGTLNNRANYSRPAANMYNLRPLHNYQLLILDCFFCFFLLFRA
jgi:hypothetical protein